MLGTTASLVLPPASDGLAVHRAPAAAAGPKAAVRLPFAPAVLAMARPAVGPAPSAQFGGISIAASVGIGSVVALQTAGRGRRWHARRSWHALAVSAAPSATTEPPVVDAIVESFEDVASAEPVMACPVCQGALTTSCSCPRCQVAYPKVSEGNFVDLTVTAAEPLDEVQATPSASASSLPDGFLQRLPGVAQLDGIAKALRLPTSSDVEGLAREVVRDVGKVIPQSNDSVLAVTTFQSPLVSFAYERGWRQQFAVNGFPGPDEEYKFAKGFLEAPLTSREASTNPPVLLDCSCGSGLFTRRFAADPGLQFKEVIALDFSESMLRQTDVYAAKEAGEKTYPAYARPLRLVRGDVGRLPFRTGSLAGVHASAAIHCWPAPEIALAELARVLEPGAALVLSTFRPSVIGGNRNGRWGGPTGFRVWSEEALRRLTRQVGLVEFEAITRDPAFIMIKVTKPVASEV